MLGFMDYVQDAWLDATQWNQLNSYSTLTATARADRSAHEALLDFSTPTSLRLHISSLASPHLATSYTLGTLGVVDGSLSYLYSSLPLRTVASASRDVRLQSLIRGYQDLDELKKPDEPWWWEIWRGGRRVDRRDTLLYGRLYLPSSTLEALYLRRLSPTQQLRISAVSDPSLKSGGTILAQHQYDVGAYTLETLYSTDSALLGVKGLYNFGRDPRTTPHVTHTQSASPQSTTPPPSRLSAGAEVYYGILNSTIGLSTGLRFTTLPHLSSPSAPVSDTLPLTLTLTLNPLMGNLSATYAVRAGKALSLASRFDFNVYSYESGVVVGCELWRKKGRAAAETGLEWAETKMGVDVDRRKILGGDEEERNESDDDGVQGVLKARMDQTGKIGLLWEGRVKELLFTLGSSFDLRRQDQPFQSIGVEVQYSS